MRPLACAAAARRAARVVFIFCQWPAERVALAIAGLAFNGRSCMRQCSIRYTTVVTQQCDFCAVDLFNKGL